MGHIFNDAVTFNGAASFNGSTSGVTASTANNTELNVIGNPINATNWAVTNTAGSNPMAVVTTTTAGDLPLSGSISSAIKFTSRTVAGAEASEYVAYSFTTPASLSGKMKIEFYLRPGSNFVTGEWTVSVYQSTTRQALSTDVSGATTLPNAAGKFTTTVDLLASTAYTLRFARPTNAGANAAVLNVTNVIVGPGIQPQGAVVGDWISYTPTGNDQWTSVPVTYTGRYRRVGDSMEVFASVVTGSTTPTGGATGSTRISLPTGFTIDTTKLNSAAANESALGTWQGSITGVGNIGGQIRKHTSNLQVELWLSATANGNNNSYDTMSASFITNGGTVVGRAYAHFTVPIAEWAGSGTVNLAQNDVEYAFNNSATTSTDTTSFGYGPDGFAIQAFAPAGTSNIQKRIQWQRPAQNGDVFAVEVFDGTNWIGMEDRLAGRSLNDAGTTAYGYSLTSVSSTQMDVNFFSAPFPGLAWSSITSFKWRVRKSSAGAAVGFGNASPGVSSGLYPATGLALFTRQKFNTGSSVTAAISSDVDIGFSPYDTSLSPIQVPRTAIYRVRISASCSGTTVANNAIQMRIKIHAGATQPTASSPVVNTQRGPRAIGHSHNITTAYRPAVHLSTEWIGSLNANDWVSFIVEFFDNPVSLGTLGGGSIESASLIVQELPVSSVS